MSRLHERNWVGSAGSISKLELTLYIFVCVLASKPASAGIIGVDSREVDFVYDSGLGSIIETNNFLMPETDSPRFQFEETDIGGPLLFPTSFANAGIGFTWEFDRWDVYLAPQTGTGLRRAIGPSTLTMQIDELEFDTNNFGFGPGTGYYRFDLTGTVSVGGFVSFHAEIEAGKGDILVNWVNTEPGDFDVTLEGSYQTRFDDRSVEVDGDIVFTAGSTFRTPVPGVRSASMLAADDYSEISFVSGGFGVTQASSPVVPEPTSLAIFGLGAIGMVAMGRRRKKQSA